MARTPTYATKKELMEHKKEVAKMIKDFKRKDLKEDKKMFVAKKRKRST